MGISQTSRLGGAGLLALAATYGITVELPHRNVRRTRNCPGFDGRPSGTLFSGAARSRSSLVSSGRTKARWATGSEGPPPTADAVSSPTGRSMTPNMTGRFSAGLGDHHLPHRLRPERARLELVAQIVQERLQTTSGLDVASGLAVDTRGVGTHVAPDPVPRHDEERRVGDEVEQVIEPATLVLASPPVQLGLNLQYPRPRLDETRPRRVRVHERPPGLTARLLRTRCRPSPCRRLSRPRTTTPAPPRPTPSADDAPARPHPGRMRGGRRRTVPTFTVEPVDEVGAQLCRCGLATPTPQAFDVASLPTTCCRPGSSPPRRAGARRFPAHIRQIRAGGLT
jgi:hypothetical protein